MGFLKPVDLPSKTEEVFDLLSRNPGARYTYGEVAVRVNSSPRAVGRCMFALGRRDLACMCARVVKKR